MQHALRSSAGRGHTPGGPGDPAMKLASFVIMAVAAASALQAPAQPDFQLHARKVTPAPADPAIARAIRSIDPARIRAIIARLVSFGTRNTLSSMEPDLPAGSGVTAAAGWIFDQFEQISTQCGGCLDVRRDTFVADPSSAAGTPW